MRDPFQRQCRPALGTLVEIALHEDDLPAAPADSQALFDAGFAAIEEVQRQMSFHDSASVLSRINRAAPGSRLDVPEWTHALLTVAMDVYRVTQGRFDCGVGGDLVRAGLLPGHGFDAAPAVCVRAGSSLARLRLDGEGGVTLLGPVCLDLGGIAKGFAVDRALDAVRAGGVGRCVVNAGGDLRVAGDMAQPIVLRSPAQPGELVPLGTLADGAVATSAPYFSRRGEGEAARCALFDPNGESLTASRSYTVIAPTCVLADALTKAVAVAAHRDGAAAGWPAGRAATWVPFHAAFLEEFEAQAFLL